MVSPIDHVVMNYQNQTRINGIWGHVRYTFDTREYHLIGRAYIRLACMQTIQFSQFVFLVFFDMIAIVQTTPFGQNSSFHTIPEKLNPKTSFLTRNTNILKQQPSYN
jgi:hypothetical protein